MQIHGSLPCHRFRVQPVHLTCCRQAAATEVIATTAAAMPNRERGDGCLTAAALLLHSAYSPSAQGVQRSVQLCLNMQLQCSN